MSVDGERVGGDGGGDDAGAGVDRLLLVENEVTEAVVNATASVVFNGLKGMGMVTDNQVGTGIYELMGEEALQADWREVVLPTPVWRYDDDGGGIGFTQSSNAANEYVVIFLANAPLLWQPRKVFQRQAQRGNKPHWTWFGCKQHRTRGIFQCRACTDGYHTMSQHLAVCVFESSSPLIHTVVVGKVEMREAMFMHSGSARKMKRL